MMEDLRIQIPTQCWVNVSIIDSLISTSLFKKHCVEVPRKIGLKGPTPGNEWPFMNPSWGAYMMYCLLVVPKELYNLPRNDPFYKDLLSRDVMQFFSISKERETFAQNPQYHLNSLRNSISHVNYIIQPNQDLVFWDHPPRKPKKRHWEVTTTENQLISFLHVMADATHRIYVEIRNGKRTWPSM